TAWSCALRIDWSEGDRFWGGVPWMVLIDCWRDAIWLWRPAISEFRAPLTWAWRRWTYVEQRRVAMVAGGAGPPSVTVRVKLLLPGTCATVVLAARPAGSTPTALAAPE